jgi:hypothetical protein
MEEKVAFRARKPNQPTNSFLNFKIQFKKGILLIREISKVFKFVLIRAIRVKKQKSTSKQ